jgi:pyrimidine-nucleoside phosphorylase
MVASGAAAELGEARARLEATITDGTARVKLRSLIASLGGDGAVVDDPTRLEMAPHRIDVIAPKDGTITRVGARAIGEVAMHLGAGRATKADVIDPAVGVVMHKRVGDFVRAGKAIATVHSRYAVGASDPAVRSILDAISWGNGPAVRPPLVIDVVR